MEDDGSRGIVIFGRRRILSGRCLEIWDDVNLYSQLWTLYEDLTYREFYRLVLDWCDNWSDEE